VVVLVVVVPLVVVVDVARARGHGPESDRHDIRTQAGKRRQTRRSRPCRTVDLIVVTSLG